MAATPENPVNETDRHVEVLFAEYKERLNRDLVATLPPEAQEIVRRAIEDNLAAIRQSTLSVLETVRKSNLPPAEKREIEDVVVRQLQRNLEAGDV